MNSETKLVLELWDYVRDMVSASKRQDVATHILRLFQEYGIEVNTSDLEGECEILDEVIANLDPSDDEDVSDWGEEY